MMLYLLSEVYEADARFNGSRMVSRTLSFLMFRGCFLYMSMHRDVPQNFKIRIHIDKLLLNHLRKNMSNHHLKRMHVRTISHDPRAMFKLGPNILHPSRTTETVIYLLEMWSLATRTILLTRTILSSNARMSGILRVEN